jgi:phosphoserine phosphatase
MLNRCFQSMALLVGLSLLVLPSGTFSQKARPEPLPSWNDGPAKKAILDFVRATTDKASKQYVPPAQRIATFDQDGTLWVEQPMYTQVMFALDRVVALAPKHPEWKTTGPFKSVLAGDRAAMAKFTMKELEEIAFATHSGMTVETFQTTVKDWIGKARHPRWKRPYTDLVYQPMLEVLRYLRASGYKTYIVTGGGQEFVRAYAERVYAVPPEQIIGSALETEFTYDKAGKGVLRRSPKLLLNNNLSGKPEDIYLFLGRRPTAAFGNSTGDRQMLEYTQGGDGARLMMLVHHDDERREYAYGAKSKIGTFSDALMAEAKKQKWVVVSMKEDWKRVFPFEK